MLFFPGGNKNLQLFVTHTVSCLCTACRNKLDLRWTSTSPYFKLSFTSTHTVLTRTEVFHHVESNRHDLAVSYCNHQPFNMNIVKSIVIKCASAVPNRLFSMGRAQTQPSQHARPGTNLTFIGRLARCVSFYRSSLGESQPSATQAASNTGSGHRSLDQCEHQQSNADNDTSRGTTEIRYANGSSRQYHVRVVSGPQQARRTLAGSSRMNLKRKESFKNDSPTGKKQKTQAHTEYESDSTDSIYTRYRADYPFLPEGGPRFQECFLHRFLDVQEYSNSVFVLMEWENVVQGSRFSWEEVHHVYADFGDHVVDFLLETEPGNKAAARALHMLAVMFEPKIWRIGQSNWSRDRSFAEVRNKPKKFLELSQYKDSILVLVEWEQRMSGSRYTYVEVSELFLYLGDSLLNHLRGKAQYSALAFRALRSWRRRCQEKIHKEKMRWSEFTSTIRQIMGPYVLQI